MNKWVMMIGLAVAVSSCTTSFESLKKMRRISSDRQAASQQDELLDEFLKGGQPAQWRAEAMRTMTHLDYEFMHRSQHPKLHNRLAHALRAEYVVPKCRKRSSASDRYLLRAWGVHALTLLDHADVIDFLADVIQERNQSLDKEYAIRAAAMNGVLARKKEMATNSRIRRKVMAACASLKNEVKPKIILNPSAKSLYDAILELESNLLSYKDSVIMLPEKASEYSESGQILQIMSWCERGIVLDDAPNTYPEAFAENLRKLLVMAEHPKLRIRRRARRILSLYAPLPFFELLHHLDEKRDLGRSEDVKDAIYLMGRLDEMKPSMTAHDLKTYESIRTLVVRHFFETIQKHPIGLRDFVLSRLVMMDLELFAALCDQHMDKLKTATPKNSQVYVKNVYFAYVRVPAGKPKLRNMLMGQITQWVNSPYLPTRRLVTHALYKTSPERLIVAKMAMFDDLKTWDPVKTDELVDGYVAALLQLEADPERLERFKKKFRERFKTSIHQPLADATTQRVEKTNTKVAEFLEERDPNVFLVTFAMAMTNDRSRQKEKRWRELILLGDLSLKVKKRLKPAALESVKTVLLAEVGTRDEEEGLLCARYLLELGHVFDEATLKSASLSVREMNTLKMEVKK